MKQRIVTGIIFTVLVAAFIIPAYFCPFFAWIFSLIVGIFASVEIYKALNCGGYKCSATSLFIGGIIACIPIGICCFAVNNYLYAISLYLLCELIYCMIVAVMPAIINRNNNPLEDGIATAASVIYVTFPLFCLTTTVMFVQNGWYYMLVALLAPWVSDVFAYFTGVLFGKHKVVPHISPKKTWEGCIGGAIWCAVTVMLYFDFIVYEIDSIHMNKIIFSILMFILGLLISVMSQIGDWFASVIKRRVGIKDYGKIFPGHGGMLDRFDSAFFTLPIGLLISVCVSFLR